MSANSSSPPSTLVEATSHSMEEVTENLRASGWEGEFRQLSKGQVTSRWKSLSLGPCELGSHRLDNRIHVRQPSPNGCVTLAIVPTPSILLVDGAEMGKDQLLVMDAGSETDFVTLGETECATLTLPKSDFEAIARALFPRMGTNDAPVGILPSPSFGWSALHGEMSGLLRNGSMSPEDFSHLLSRFLGLMAGEQEKRQQKVRLSDRRTGYVARRAQEYIEDHFRQSIRVDEICRYSGVSLSTLGRSFFRYFQVTPREYIKACRFNAARQGLLAGDPLHHKVGEIALANGFMHLGRFSVEYFEYFGEAARETLARQTSSQAV